MEKRRWLLAELHCHSTKSDGNLTPEEIVTFYEKRGYDVLAITDHDVFTEASSERMIIIPACEWTFKKERLFFSHLLIYFLEKMPSSIDDAVSQGAFLCVTHPATWPWWKSKIPSQVKGYEVFNHKLNRKFGVLGKIANKISSVWYGKFYKGRVAGADAHGRSDYAKVKCWIWAEPNLEDIKQALLKGKIKIEN